MFGFFFPINTALGFKTEHFLLNLSILLIMTRYSCVAWETITVAQSRVIKKATYCWIGFSLQDQWDFEIELMCLCNASTICFMS